jgi:hypothetical protein
VKRSRQASAAAGLMLLVAGWIWTANSHGPMRDAITQIEA